MALTTSGQISLNDVNVELGNSGTAQIDMNSSAVRGLFGISSGEIEMADGYGKSNTFTFTISSNTQNANLRSLALSAGWNGSSNLEATVNSGVWLWSNSRTTAGLIVSGSFPGGATVKNYGKIIGRGGNSGNTGSSSQSGGPGLSISSSNITIANQSGAFIAGGGGGGGSGHNGDTGTGGGGAGGGASGRNTTRGSGGSAGGAIGQSGSQGSTFYRYGQGGGSGGGGAAYFGGSGGDNSFHGGGGGRILPGTGGAGAQGSGIPGGGGNGGSAGNAGQSSLGQASGGGGGWGASGGSGSYSGGSGGAAISKTTSYTLTNSGTIYGST